MFYITNTDNSANHLQQARAQLNCKQDNRANGCDNTLQSLLYSLVGEDQLIHSRLIGRLYWLRKEEGVTPFSYEQENDDIMARHHHQELLRIVECKYGPSAEAATKKTTKTKRKKSRGTKGTCKK